MEAHLKVPEVSALDTDVLLLVVPDSAHTTNTPITLGTLHIDMGNQFSHKNRIRKSKQMME